MSTSSSSLRQKDVAANTEPDASKAGDAQGHPLSFLDLQNDSLGYAVKRAQVRTYEMLFSILGPDALSPGRMTALSIVATKPGINQSELAEMLGITRAGVVKVVDTLESLRFVERRKIPDNRRSYALVVTKAGLDELRRLSVLTQRYEEKIASRISKAERRQLMSLLDKIAT
ncbi:MarR family winged helix-turn-helix transcriptional regulator [Eoetvoesiella caeni]|uniref:DNA-binding MarR family transcriptional regulator n=1 Tax=Eoetvoesiella caeni TaxID=645616 RepID=A0A366HB32_9BURK|nr:MarR family transcriptional regulator [Eoetvoesiella caeni]MCI2809208.1 MarR family transcriptional regulator [Eoetvoesiella caeni]RBP39464.1 DNA-binding MarR family transcriptional regulator [Eoetvoesiella caeni]